MFERRNQEADDKTRIIMMIERNGQQLKLDDTLVREWFSQETLKTQMITMVNALITEIAKQK
jgi:hypothetical protein